MSGQTTQKSLFVRWKTLRGLSAIIGFVIAASLLELVVVAYSMSIGIVDSSVVSYTIDGLTLSISPLYHFVPIAVVLALVTSWIYLTKVSAMRPREPLKTGQQSKRAPVPAAVPKGFMPRLRSELLRTSIRSAVIVVFVFLAFTFIMSMLAFPDLIFRTISNAYSNNPELLGFIKGSGELFAPLANFVNGAIPIIGPGFRDFASSLGSSLAPVANLDAQGKYLFFQNMAAWLSAFVALVYGEFFKRGYRYRRIR